MALRRSIIKNLNTENTDIAEQTPEEPKQIEVSAQITLPPDGGWGWVVVMASFFISSITDGVVVTFGCIYGKLLHDLNLTPTLASLVNSVTVSSSFCFGPIVSAFINRFGFRLCVMIGSIITAVACLLTFLLGDYTSLLFFYGLLSGLGMSMVNMGCLLVVGFYFQKWRALAFTIAATGSSIGVIFFSLLYTETAHQIGWQYTILLQASMLALCYFFAFAYRPLLSVTVVQATIQPKTEIQKSENTDVPIIREKSLSNTSAPSLPKIRLKHSDTFKPKSKSKSILLLHPLTPIIADEENATERTFLAETNDQFPTVAEMIHDLAEEVLAKGSVHELPCSSDYLSRLTLIANNEPFHDQNLDEIRPLLAEAISKANLKEGDTSIDKGKSLLEIIRMPRDSEQTDDDGPAEVSKSKSFMSRVFQWQEHVAESRPLYRDDAFLQSTAKPDNEEVIEDPIEYQLKVSRVALAGDLKERRGIFTTAFKRVLATMLDPKFLKRISFISICISMLLFYSGYLIPLIFVTERGERYGIPLDMRMWFLSAVGLSGIFGRFLVSVLVSKFTPMKVTIGSHFLAGFSTLGSCYLPGAVYQIGYCSVFGLTTAGASIVRSLIIVRLYGLENLTNCTGMVFLFQGLGCLISPPLAGALIRLHDDAPFYYAAACLIGSALLIIPVSKLVDKENGIKAEVENPETPKGEKSVSISQDEPMTLTKLVESLQTETHSPIKNINETVVDDQVPNKFS